MSKFKLKTLTTTIEGQFLRAIVDGNKSIECRDIKPYWDKTLAKFETPFLLRLINGMKADAPEVTIEVVKVRKDKRISKNRPVGVYCLYLGEIKNRKNLKNLVKSKS